MRTLPIILAAMACSADPELLPTEQAPPPLVFETTGMVLGHPTELRVSGAQVNDTVYLGYSFTGPGAGPCPQGVAGCLGIENPVLIGTVATGADGVARLPLNLPRNLPASEVWFQAATVGPRSELSNVLNEPFLASGGDADGDGISNGEEADLGMNSNALDSDGAGADDALEFAVGTDGANGNDDVLHDIATINVTLTVDLDFRGFLASTACLTTGYCDCSVTYQGTGNRSDAWDLTVEFDGTWTQVSNDCTPDLDWASALWTPNNGAAYHTATFNADADELLAWGVAASPGPLMAVPDPIAAEQGYLDGLSLPWDQSSPMTFTTVDDSVVSGVDLRSTVTTVITPSF